MPSTLRCTLCWWRPDHLPLRRLSKVGWIFTQSAAERDYIMNSEEVQQMAAAQDELGPAAVTGVVSVVAPDEDDDEAGGASIHFEVRRSLPTCHCLLRQLSEQLRFHSS